MARRVWAKRGEQPLALSHHLYQWLYLYAFVHPASGAVEWWLANSVNAPLFEAILRSFAATVGAGAEKTVILVLDNAGWHVAKELTVPEGVELCFLPPYTPELQPAERLWPLTDEAVANKPYESLDELSQTLEKRCLALTAQPDLIKAKTSFKWWPTV